MALKDRFEGAGGLGEERSLKEVEKVTRSAGL